MSFDAAATPNPVMVSTPSPSKSSSSANGRSNGDNRNKDNGTDNDANAFHSEEYTGPFCDDEEVKERSERIRELELVKAQQDEELKQLRIALGQKDVECKQELYWVQLELDQVKREKEEIEDRADVLMRDLVDMQQNPPSNLMHHGDVVHEQMMQWHQQLQQFPSARDAFLEQIRSVRAKSSELMAEMKDEIEGTLEEKVQMERDLIAQLASLDSETRTMEWSYEEDLRAREEQLVTQEDKQRKNNSRSALSATGASSSSLVEEYEDQVDALAETRDALQQELQDLTDRFDDKINLLESDQDQLEERRKELEAELEVMRGGAAAESIQIVDALQKDRAESHATLERIAQLWDKAHDSVHILENAMDELRPTTTHSSHQYPNKGYNIDRERLISTLETASLVHTEIKSCMLLLESKLRRQLASLKNDQVVLMQTKRSPLTSMVFVSPREELELTELVTKLQKAAVTVVERVEDTLEGDLQPLMDKDADRTTEDRRQQLKQANDAVRKMSSQLQKAESTVHKLRTQQQDSHHQKQQHDDKEDTVKISAAAFDKLEGEVLLVVDRLKAKNEAIEQLESTLSEQKLRVSIYKRQQKMQRDKAASGS